MIKGENKPTAPIRFGPFEAHVSTGELLKDGRVVRLQDQPFQVLRVLLEHEGELVTREQLREQIWGGDTYVDFDRSLNTAVARLREALGDSPNRPSYIETIPRKGYRFIYPLNATPPTLPPEPEPARESRRRRWIRAVFAAILASGLALAWSMWPHPSSPRLAAPLAAQPLTHYRGIENEATFSPDGSQFAFTWNGDAQDNFDVYVRTVDGEELVRLTDHPARDLSPAWSPDGQWIAYGRRVSEDRVAVLRQSPLGGREEELLRVSWTPEWFGARIAYSKFLAWGADSRRLIVSHLTREEKTALHSFDLETGELRQLTDPETPWADLDPAVASDGLSLSFTRTNHTNMSGFVLPLSSDFEPSGEPRRVTPQSSFIASAWHPRAGRLLFSGPIQRPGLWLVDPTGHEKPVPIPVEAGVRGVLPAIRADGKIAVTSVSFDANIWRLDLGPESGRIESRELIGSTNDEFLPAYSPDGESIVFISRRGKGLFLANADGSNQVQFLPGCSGSRWSPDGSQLVCDVTASIENRHGDLWLANATGGPMKQLTSTQANDRMPNWSRDGKWIYFSSDRSGSNQIWKMPVGGEEPDAVQVTKQGGFFATESLDGEVLYYTRSDEKGLWRLSLAGGVEEKFNDALVDVADYAVSRDGVYYAARGIPGAGGAIYFYRFEDETATQVFRLQKAFGVGVDVSPDGRYVLYTQYDREESDLMLLEGFE